MMILIKEIGFKRHYIFIVIVLALILLSSCAQQVTEDTKKTTEIVIRVKRDLTNNETLRKDLCDIKTKEYIDGKDFKKKGFSECILIESKAGIGLKDCPESYTPMCRICRLECK